MISNSSFSDSLPQWMIKNCTPDKFRGTSKCACKENLYDIMNSNIDIPAADIAILVFSCEGCDYLGFLYELQDSAYSCHLRAEGGNRNDILQRALLPAQGQKLSEAFAIRTSPTGSAILLTEKKYEVNGEKRFYFFSELFLEMLTHRQQNQS